MDELTIADQKYLSSKKAAQVTGYAKDYVGQLCREGRVDARLVGRNWYVLEASILAHRFGPEDAGITEQIKDSVPETSPWNSPTYMVENTPSIAPLIEKTPYIVPTVEPLREKVLTDMQSAWQEWFKSQAKAPKKLEEPSDMLLEATYPDAPVHSPEPETPQIHIERVHEPQEAPYAPEEPVDAEVPVQIHRTHQEFLRPSPQSAVRQEYAGNTSPIYQEEAPRRTSFMPRGVQNRQKSQFPGHFALSAVFVGIIGLTLVVTFIASGGAENYMGAGKSNALFDYLSGKIQSK